MPASNAWVTNPFTGKAKKKTTKPTGAPTTGRAAAISDLARINNQYSPPGPSTAPLVTQRRTSDQQPMVDPFAALAGPSGAGPSGMIGQPGGAGFQAAAAPGVNDNVGTTMATLAAASAAGNPAFPTGSGYAAQTPLGRSYRDLMLPSAWDDPEALIDTMYRVSGWDKGSGDYGVQLENADNLGILYMALMGDQAFQGNANFVDWASHYLQNGRRADGRSISPGEVWNALINPDANSPLNYYLNNPSLAPEDQVNNMMSSLRYGLETTLPAPILNALLAQVDQVGREFRSLRNTQAGSASFSEYMGSRPGSLPAF